MFELAGEEIAARLVSHHDGATTPQAIGANTRRGRIHSTSSDAGSFDSPAIGTCAWQSAILDCNALGTKGLSRFLIGTK